MAQVGHVKQCVQVDELGTCTLEQWMPAPSLLPPLDAASVGELLTATAFVFAMAWGGKMLGRTVRD